MRRGRSEGLTQNDGKKTSNRLRNEEHKADALAIGAEEGRGKLR